MLEKLKMLSLATLLFMGLAGLSACNTMEGAGEDIEAAGEGIEESASKNKSY